MTTRLFHVSDIHFGREDRTALGWFADRVHAERPAAVVVTGDLTMRARSHEFAAASKWLSALGVPVTVEVGNHDLPYFNPLARFLSPYRRFQALERAVERPLDLPGLWLVPLKTTARAQWRLNWSWGVVSRAALAEALERLSLCPADHVALVAAHHPLLPPGKQRKGATQRGRHALAALAAAGAQAVLSGHVHDPFDRLQEVDGRLIRMIGAGTLSERVRSSPPSFNELIVRPGRFEVRHRLMNA